MGPDVEQRLKAEAEFQNARVRAGMNEESEARDRFYYLAEKAIRRYRSTLNEVAGKHVLVVGCSEGGVTPLARRGATVIGIDIADQAIANLNASIAEEGWQDVATAKVMNAEALDVPDDSLDIICCSGVLHHLNVEKAAASWARALKPDGRVTMIEPMAYNPLIAAYRLATPSMRTDDEHPLTPKDIDVLRQHFGDVDVEGFVLTSLLSVTWAYLPDLLKLRSRSLKLLEPLDQALMSKFPALAYLAWTAVIQLRDPH